MVGMMVVVMVVLKALMKAEKLAVCWELWMADMMVVHWVDWMD